MAVLECRWLKPALPVEKSSLSFFLLSLANHRRQPT